MRRLLVAVLLLSACATLPVKPVPQFAAVEFREMTVGFMAFRYDAESLYVCGTVGPADAGVLSCVDYGLFQTTIAEHGAP